MRYIIVFLVLISTTLSNQSNDECIKMAYNDYKNHDIEAAFNRLKSCEVSILGTDDPKLMARYYHALASCYRKMDDLDSALKYQNLSITLKENYDYNYAISDNYNELAIIYKNKDLFSKAIFYVNKAINHNKKHSPELLHINYLTLSSCYNRLGISDSSIKYNNLALNDIYLTDYNYMIANNNLSDIYTDLKQYEKAINYLKIAMNSKSLNTRLKLKFSSSLNTIKLKSKSKFDADYIKEYYNNAKTLSDTIYSSFNYSLLKLKNKEYENSDNLILGVVEVLETHENYKLASEYLLKYLDYAYNFKDYNSIIINSKIPILLNKYKIRLNQEYQNDLKIIANNKEKLKVLSNKISNAELSNQLLIGVLILSFIVGNFTFFWYRKHRIVRFLSLSMLKLKTENQKSNKYIINNLAKVMFVLHYKLDEEIDQEIFKALDESINELDNSNQQLSFYSNKLEEKYAKTESTLQL